MKKIDLNMEHHMLNIDKENSSIQNVEKISNFDKTLKEHQYIKNKSLNKIYNIYF